MKYGESIFDIVYLFFAIISGIIILVKRKDNIGRLMGCATLILGCGDAFHLVPRVLNYFIDADFTVFLGVGKLITSVTMTVFYILMYRLWVNLYQKSENKILKLCVYLLGAIRVILCLFPQNGWFTNQSPFIWAVARNIPFIALGVIIICLFFNSRKEISKFRNVYLTALLSFVFYIPVATAAGFVPMLGMLMLPKTVCYMVLICTFLQYSMQPQK